jgi:hypothetical protein
MPFVASLPPVQMSLCVRHVLHPCVHTVLFLAWPVIACRYTNRHLSAEVRTASITASHVFSEESMIDTANLMTDEDPVRTGSHRANTSGSADRDIAPSPCSPWTLCCIRCPRLHRCGKPMFVVGQAPLLGWGLGPLGWHRPAIADGLPVAELVLALV